jgi:3-methyl-2-oxobutanoate hydroxymethyltransferase
MAKVTVNDLLKKKSEGRKITMITAYDFPFARIADEAGVASITRCP